MIEPKHAEAIVNGKSLNILKSGNFNKVPIMIGHTSLEARSGDSLSSKQTHRH